MSLKTKFPQLEIKDAEPEFRPYFAISFFAVSLVVLLALYAAAQYWSHYKTPQTNFLPQQIITFQFFIFPWIVAAGQTIGNGMIAFSGAQLEPISTANNLMTLLSLVVVYIIVPTIFFFQWRARRLKKMENPAAPRQMPTISFLTSSLMLLYTIIPMLPVLITQPSRFENLKENEAVQWNRSHMMNDIINIAWSARQYRILPKELGGGEGSYKGYIVPNKLRDTENATYAVSAADNEITIYATSNKNSSATIFVHLGKEGEFSEWRFNGVFSTGVPYSPWKMKLRTLRFRR